MSGHRTGGPTLDGHAIRTRRLGLNLSERMFANRLGGTFSTASVRSIENENASAELTLGDVRRIADALDVPVAAIVVVADSPAGVVAWPGDDSLARKLGATLLALKVPVPRDTLARALNTDLATLTGALERVNGAVSTVGLQVQQAGDMVALAPAFKTAPADTLEALTRQHLARAELDISQANLLSRAARGEKWKLRGNAETVTKGALLNAGLLEHNASGGLQLTADVAYSLLMSD